MNTGLVIALVGVALVVVGLLAWTGALSWFGHLPGDVRVQRESFSFYMPITSMIVASIVLSALLALARRFF